MINSTQILLFLIGIIYPIYFICTHKKVNHRIKKDGKYRLIDYKQTILIFWMLTVLVLGNSIFDHTITLNFYPHFNTLGIVFALLIVVFIGLQIFTSKVSTKEDADLVIQKMKTNYFYFPKSKSEFIWFNLLSLSAGICEEIIFRMFMFSYFLEQANIAIALLLANGVFAITHIGFGRQNTIVAFLTGILFSVMYYFSNNIWLPILLHSSMDMGIGYLSYQAEKTLKRANIA